MLNLFKRKKAYTTPGGTVSSLYLDMATQPHLLVAGATGSGKSVVINGILHGILVGKTPASAGLILVDPKRVELVGYRNTPHCITYASEPADMVNALKTAIRITEDRYRQMQTEGVRKYTGGDVWVVIDELADLMTTNRREVQPLLQRLCQIGRAAKVHVIAATQCPLATVIPTAIKVNFDARVGLRTRSAQDSRNILGQTGCETLPRYGQGYYMKPEGNTLYNIPMVSDGDIENVINYWTSKRCVA